MVVRLLAAIAAAVVAGCSMVEEIRSGARPSARVTGLSIKEFGLEEATVVLDTEVSNPFSVDIPLVNVEYALASKGKQFLSGKADLQGMIPSRGAKTFSVPVKVVYLSLLDVLTGIKPGSVLPYEAALKLGVEAPGVGAISLPIAKEGELPVPAVPEVSVQDLTWENVTLERAAGVLKLAIGNPNEFPLSLSKLTYSFSLGGIEVASSELAKGLELAANGGKGSLEIPLSFSPGKLGLAAISILRGKGATYKLSAGLEAQTPFGPLAVPIEKAGDAKLRLK